MWFVLLLVVVGGVEIEWVVMVIVVVFGVVSLVMVVFCVEDFLLERYFKGY